MAKVDPNARANERKEQGWSEVPEEGKRAEWVSMAQRAPLAAVGWEIYEAGTGTPGILVRFVVLAGPDKGKITERTFWLSDGARSQLADFALAIGFREPFDDEDENDLQRLFTKGALMGEIKEDSFRNQRTGKIVTKFRPDSFYPLPSDRKPSADWNAIMEAGEAGWARYQKWRETHPRGEEAQWGGDQGGGGGGSGGGAAQGGGGGRGGGYDDDIPF